MVYLLCFCLVCKMKWNYYDEKDDPDRMSAAVQYQGTICPRCGRLGVMASPHEEVPEGNGDSPDKTPPDEG